jgi:hypothetical protein
MIVSRRLLLSPSASSHRCSPYFKVWGRVHSEFSVAIKMAKAAATLSLMKKGTTQMADALCAGSPRRLRRDRQCDVHEQYVWRFLRAQKIDLSGRKSWCESNDPEFVAKAAEIVGLYMASEGTPVRQFEIALRSLQSLDRRLSSTASTIAFSGGGASRTIINGTARRRSLLRSTSRPHRPSDRRRLSGLPYPCRS